MLYEFFEVDREHFPVVISSSSGSFVYKSESGITPSEEPHEQQLDDF